jgi:hypothetical protein
MVMTSLKDRRWFWSGISGDSGDHCFRHPIELCDECGSWLGEANGCLL